MPTMEMQRRIYSLHDGIDGIYMHIFMHWQQITKKYQREISAARRWVIWNNV